MRMRLGVLTRLVGVLAALALGGTGVLALGEPGGPAPGERVAGAPPSPQVTAESPAPALRAKQLVRQEPGPSPRRAAAPASPAPPPRQEGPASVLYLWAGHMGASVGSPLSPTKEFDVVDGSDFLAVVDADPRSPTYGRILRTVSVPTLPTGNEPHHMQPFIPPGCASVFAGGLFSDFWFTFDVTDPLEPRHAGTISPAQTLGTVPDAAFVLPSCEALGTEMGGPSGGPHGTVIRMDPTGNEVVEEKPADRIPTDLLCESQWNPALPLSKPGGPFTRKTSEEDCLPSNPHGIWARPDLNTLVTSDYAEPRRLILPEAPTSDVAKLTVRHYALNPACTGPARPPAGTPCIGDPRVVLLPDGSRNEANEGHKENVGVMETTTTNPPGALNPTGSTPPGYLPSNGAFAATMCGGALYYSPDITAERPVWREVYDFTAANQVVNPGSDATAGCTGGGGVAVTPDNRFLVHSIIGRDPGQSDDFIGSGTNPAGFPGMIVLLDIARLVSAGDGFQCAIDSPDEVWRGGAEADCPTVADIHPVADPSPGGPHFFSFDYPNGAGRLAYFNYFVSETGVSGNLQVCMLEIRGRRLVLDSAFPAAVDGQRPGTGCISFNRADWPADRGPGAGPAKPHYGLFRNTR